VRVALVVVVIAGLVGPAHAEDWLAKAREHETALDYAGGLAIVEQGLQAGGLDAARWVELHVLGGKFAAGLERTADAEAHFAAALAIKPDVVLPEGTSPKITGPFEAVKARTVRLAILVRANSGVVSISPAADPLGLVVGISVTIVEAGTNRELVDRNAKQIAIPARAKALDVTALDRHGNRIWTGRVPDERTETVAPIHRPRSWIARWPTWATVTGVALATGGIAAWRFGVAQDEWDRLRAEGAAHDFTELQRVEDRGRRWAIAANVAFGASALAGIATIVFAIRGDERAPVVIAGPTGVGLRARF
jgi:hypothetical protein